MKKALCALVLSIACLFSTVAVAADSICLPDPSTAFCPTCPSVAMCFTIEDWLDFYFPYWAYL